jgi:hypothetical protein
MDMPYRVVDNAKKLIKDIVRLRLQEVPLWLFVLLPVHNVPTIKVYSIVPLLRTVMRLIVQEM